VIRDLVPVDGALVGILGVEAADALAVVPESVTALPAGAPAEPSRLDRP
jgi:hypothetical protein